MSFFWLHLKLFTALILFSLTSCSEEQLTHDSDDEYQYEQVPVDEDFVTEGGSQYNSSTYKSFYYETEW